MSLPIVIIFEQHWDTIPKFIIKELLPDLKKKGYESWCFEAPHNLSSSEIIERHNYGLEEDSQIENESIQLLKRRGIVEKLNDMQFDKLSELLKLYVSSKRYEEGAEKIKNLNASRILKEAFDQALDLSILLKGVDIDSKDFDSIFSVTLSQRMSNIRLLENRRISSFFRNILELRSQQEEGIIFHCGALHAQRVINEFKKSGLQDKVLYYFPYSSKSCEDTRVLVDRLLKTNDVLQNHTYPLSKEEVKPFKEKIIQEIIEKTSYTREILEGNSHSQFLSDYFKMNFRAFVRPGNHVDAVIAINDLSHIENIQQHMTAVTIQTHSACINSQNYLVIPNVNTSDVAERIRKISEFKKRVTL